MCTMERVAWWRDHQPPARHMPAAGRGEEGQRGSEVQGAGQVRPRTVLVKISKEGGRERKDRGAGC